MSPRQWPIDRECDEGCIPDSHGGSIINGYSKASSMGCYSKANFSMDRLLYSLLNGMLLDSKLLNGQASLKPPE
jgi:hypothetical protein